MASTMEADRPTRACGITWARAPAGPQRQPVRRAGLVGLPADRRHRSGRRPLEADRDGVARPAAPEGGWDYGTLSDQTPAMTAAGIASLFIVGDYLHSAEAIGCLGNAVDPWIDKGIAWLDKNYDRIGTAPMRCMGIERIGAASGYKYFASHDWYVGLAQRLLIALGDDGSFNCTNYPGANHLDATCFGLLFLARGRAPVMMNKLDYHIPRRREWSRSRRTGTKRPRDVANLTAFAGRQAETFLQWQIVNFKASPEDLHDAPVLYLSGNIELKPTADDAK